MRIYSRISFIVTILADMLVSLFMFISLSARECLINKVINIKVVCHYNDGAFVGSLKGYNFADI